MADQQDDRTRLLLLLTSTAGGAGVHAFYLAKHLSRDAFAVTVAYGPGYPVDADMEALDLPIVHLSMSRDIAPLRNLRAFFQVLGLLRRQRFDIICMECSIAGFVGRVAAWLMRVPVSVYIVQVFASHANQSTIKRMIYRIMEQAMRPLTTRFVAVSEAMKRFGAAHGIMPPDKVDVIYNAIPMDDKIPADRAKARAALGLSSDGPIVGTLARMEPQKGLPYFLEAAQLVRREMPKVEFLIAGDGPMRGELEEQVRRLGIEQAVHFVGWRTDVVEILSAIDIFCLPSLWESFGIVFAESMAMRTPVVATTVDGIPEVVADGETGILVPPRDAPAVAEALLQLLRDPALVTRMGDAGRLRVEQKFTVEMMVEQYESLFHSLLPHQERDDSRTH